MVKALGIILVAAIISAGTAVWYVRSEAIAFLDTRSAPSEDGVIIEIPKGSTPHAAAELLASHGIVKNARYFDYLLRYMTRYENAGSIKWGEYQFKGGMSPREIADKLFKGDRYLHKVTIPEGLRYEEIAAIMEEAGLADSAKFIKLCTNRELLNLLGIQGASVEGYLFPDTYFFEKNPGEEKIIRAMVRRHMDVFARYYSGVLRNGLDGRKGIILASIVEKETGAPQERPLIARVFYNRLAKGMKLQTDPTVIYGIIRSKGAFSGNLRRKDLQTYNEFNTYAIDGLPPGPICNPGADALKAVAEPADSKALFFVSKNNGTHEFCPNLKCHNQAVQKWQVEFFKRPAPAQGAAKEK